MPQTTSPGTGASLPASSGRVSTPVDTLASAAVSTDRGQADVSKDETVTVSRTRTASPVKATAAERESAMSDATRDMLAGARLSITAAKATLAADAGWILSATSAAKALAIGVSANAQAKANATAVAADPSLKAEAEQYDVPLYCSREAVGYHAATGRLYLLADDATSPLLSRASDVQTIVRAARDTASAEAADAVIGAATSRASAVKALQTLTRNAKAEAAEAAKAKAKADAERAVSEQQAADAADAADVSTGRGQDDAAEAADVVAEAEQVAEDAATLVLPVGEAVSAEQAHARLLVLLAEAATLAEAHGLPAEAAALLGRILK